MGSSGIQKREANTPRYYECSFLIGLLFFYWGFFVFQTLDSLKCKICTYQYKPLVMKDSKMNGTVMPLLIMSSLNKSKFYEDLTYMYMTSSLDRIGARGGYSEACGHC